MRRAILALCLLGCTETVPGPYVRDCRLHVEYTGGVSVTLTGDLQGRLARQGERWAASIELPLGRSLYALDVDGQRVLDPGNPLSLRANGREWSVVDNPGCASPELRLTARTHRADGVPSYTFAFVRTEAKSALAAAHAVVDGVPAALTLDEDTLTFDASEISAGKHVLVLTATDDAGREARLEAPFWVEAQPFRWTDAQIYQVVLDRFDGAAFDSSQPIGARFGGDIPGLTARIESGALDDLGINVLWISPLSPTPSGEWVGVEGGPPRYTGYHGYWPIASRTVDPRLGTEAEVEALLATAHARGIRVLVDVVLNHVHEQHPYFTEHRAWFGDQPCACGTASCPWFSHIETCWFTPYLPDVDWGDPAVLDAQVDDALWWIERFGFDGLRVDAVPMMPRFVTRHLTERLHRRFEGLRTRHFLMGETFTGPGLHDQIRWYLGPDGLDGQYDFPLMWAIREVFAAERQPLWHLADVWAISASAWAGSSAVMGTMVGNHDVSRFLSEAAGQRVDRPWSAPPPVPDDDRAYARLALAQTFVLTAPGAPTLYYGDEFGMPGANDPDNRRAMRFEGLTDAQNRLRAQVSRLGRLRHCLPSLRRGELSMLRADAERLAYLRDSGDGAPAIIMLSRRPTDGAASLVGVPPGDYTEIFTGARVAADNSGLAPLSSPPYTARVLIPTDHECLAD